jgi:tetratricopeptide (TPR) repeat protein
MEKIENQERSGESEWQQHVEARDAMLATWRHPGENYEKAIAEQKNYIDAHPPNYTAYGWLAKTLQKAERWEESIQTAREALNLATNAEERLAVQKYIAEALYKIGDFDAVITECQSFIAPYENHIKQKQKIEKSEGERLFFIFIYLGDAWTKKQNVSEAKKVFEMASQVYEDEPFARFIKTQQQKLQPQS